MKCFSLVAQNYLFATAAAMGYPRGGATYVVDAYPKPQAGFELDSTDRVLKVGFVERVAASPELLRLAPETGAITRDGSSVRVLRASISTESGKPVLVPEKPEDADKALLYLDIGSGHQTNVRYETTSEQLVAHSRADGEPYTERCLVVLNKFEPVVAVRSSPKWWFFGEDIVRETVTIMFDGQNIFFNTARPERRKKK